MINLTELYYTYSKIKENQVLPMNMLKIMLYGIKLIYKDKVQIKHVKRLRKKFYELKNIIKRYTLTEIEIITQKRILMLHL